MDFELEHRGAQMYYAMTRAFARMCAWYHRSVALSPQLDYLFAPKERADGLIYKRIAKQQELGPMETRLDMALGFVKSLTRDQVMGMSKGYTPQADNVVETFLEMGLGFMDKAKALFPKDLVTDAFKKQLKDEAMEAQQLSGFINWWVTEIFPELTVLSHPNIQVDNALYWHDDQGKTWGGILDWDGVSHMPIPVTLASGWHGAEVDVMDAHEEGLCHAFVEEMLSAGGPCCSKEHFHVMVKMARTTLISGIFGSLGKLYQLVPKDVWPEIKNRHDKRIMNAFLPRCYSCGPVMVICGWKSRNPMPYLRKFAKDCGAI